MCHFLSATWSPGPSPRFFGNMTEEAAACFCFFLLFLDIFFKRSIFFNYHDQNFMHHNSRLGI